MPATEQQPDSSNLEPEAREAILAAIKRGAESYEPRTQGGSFVRDLAEAYAFVVGAQEPGARPHVVVRH